MFDKLDRIADRFVPQALGRDPGTLSRARSYIFVHLFGMPFGLCAAALLWYFEGRLTAANGIFLAGLLLFAAYPFVMRRLARLELLGIASVLLFSALLFLNLHNYGGLASPILPWAVSVPVVAVFFVNPRASAVTVGVVLAGFGTLYGMQLGGYQFPDPLGETARETLMLASVGLLLLYVSAMAAAHHRIYLSVQRRLAEEIEGHRRTERALVSAKEAAESANMAKSRFLAQMSHELRTPLNAIIGFSELIRRDVQGADAARYRDYAADINGSGRHLLQLVNEILDLARIEAGKLELSEEPVAVPEIMEELRSFAEAIARPKRIKVHFFDETAVPVRLQADGGRLKQALTNLVSNAIKFTEAGGQVSMHVEWAGDGGIAFVVDDTGVGIGAAERRRVIQPFERGANVARKGLEGSGLGLPIAIHLVQLHGGQLTINERGGGGTSVEVWLPAHRVHGVPDRTGAPMATGGVA